jgi:hypothetical protein
MRKWGWEEGKGLGRHEDGRVEPVSAAAHQFDKRGLGASKSSARVAATQQKGEKQTNPVVAVVKNGGIVYGKVQGLALRVYELDLKGTPHATEERVHFSQDELRERLRGGEGESRASLKPHSHSQRDGG